VETLHENQGNSLYSYLKQTKMSFFFFYRIKEQEGRTGPVWGVWYQWEGGEYGDMGVGG
jgi:hypothetical protein